MIRKIQIKRDLAANFIDSNIILSSGEPALETDTRKEKIGDGATPWIDLPYRGSIQEDTEWIDLKGNQKDINLIGFTDGTEQGISDITITSQVIAFDSQGQSFGNGVWVSVGVDSPYVRTSVDGLVWIEETLSGVTGALKDVAFGNGRFVATQDDLVGFIKESVNGKVWTNITVPVNYYGAIFFVNGKFVIINESNNSELLVSNDIGGFDIVPLIGAFTNEKRSISYGNGVYVLTGTSAQIAYSSDLSTWQNAVLPLTVGTESIVSSAFGNGFFIAITFGGTHHILKSIDGESWVNTILTTDPYEELTSISFGNGVFAILPGYASYASLYTSINGNDWVGKNSNDPNSRQWARLSFAENIFLSLANNSAAILRTEVNKSIKFENNINEVITHDGTLVPIVDKTLVLPEGLDGKSAYQEWLNLGNVGSEQDFIDSLKGLKGDQGNPGIDGTDAIWVEMTQAAYDLASPKPDGLVIIVG